MKIQILPLKNGYQTIYKGIELAGVYTPDTPSPSDTNYELPTGTYELVKTTIITTKDKEELKNSLLNALDNKDIIEQAARQGSEDQNQKYTKAKTLYIAIPTMGWLNTGLAEWADTTARKQSECRVHFYKNISPVSFARNRIVEKFLESKYNVLIMVDADTVPPDNTVDTLMELIEAGADVATGITPIVLSSIEKKANVYRNTVDVEKHIQIQDLPSVPFEVAGCGASCIMITREILEKLPKPYFKTIEYDEGKICSEDLYFCEQVRKVGGTIVAHPDVVCGHVKEMTFY